MSFLMKIKKKKTHQKTQQRDMNASQDKYSDRCLPSSIRAYIKCHFPRESFLMTYLEFKCLLFPTWPFVFLRALSQLSRI